MPQLQWQQAAWRSGKYCFDSFLQKEFLSFYWFQAICQFNNLQDTQPKSLCWYFSSSNRHSNNSISNTRSPEMLNRTVQKGAVTVVQTIDNESPKQMISAKRNQLKLIPFQEQSDDQEQWNAPQISFSGERAPCHRLRVRFQRCLKSDHSAQINSWDSGPLEPEDDERRDQRKQESDWQRLHIWQKRLLLQPKHATTDL